MLCERNMEGSVRSADPSNAKQTKPRTRKFSASLTSAPTSASVPSARMQNRGIMPGNERKKPIETEKVGPAVAPNPSSAMLLVGSIVTQRDDGSCRPREVSGCRFLERPDSRRGEGGAER